MRPSWIAWLGTTRAAGLLRTSKASSPVRPAANLGSGLVGLDVHLERPAVRVGLVVDAGDGPLERLAGEGVEDHPHDLAVPDLGDVLLVHLGAHDEGLGADVGDLHDVVVDAQARPHRRRPVEDDAVHGLT